MRRTVIKLEDLIINFLVHRYAAIAYIAFIGLLLACSFSDIKFRIIPNTIVLAIIVIGFSLNLFTLQGVGSQNAVLGFGAGFLILLPFYIFASLGAGDVKLMAAIGSVVGLDKVLDVIVDSIFVMFFISLIFIVVKGDLFRLLYRFKLFVESLILQGVIFYQRPAAKEAAAQLLPMAPAIMLATIYVFGSIIYHSF